MSKQSAGILVFRRYKDQVEVLLVHPGGPFWAKKDDWSIPKGELDEGEDHLAAAFREFEEEVGMTPPQGDLIDLGSLKQSGGKTNFIWAVEGELDLQDFKSNTFMYEWPPKSGSEIKIPEVDRAEWFDLTTAKTKLFKAQIEFIDRLADQLGADIDGPPADEQQSLL